MQYKSFQAQTSPTECLKLLRGALISWQGFCCSSASRLYHSTTPELVPLMSLREGESC